MMLAKDIRDGTWIVPAFAHAARLTRTIATVACAAESGTRQTVANS